jgi:hypothetical protein
MQPMNAMPLLEVPLLYETADGTTHAPLVIATVRGRQAPFIVDTGMSGHLLTMELAAELELEGEPGEAGTDSTGSSVPSWSLGEVPIQIGPGWFTLEDVAGIAGPPPFLRMGIGGGISPQQLHATAWAVLDLRSDTLALLDGEQPIDEWLTARHPELRHVVLDRVPDDEGILLVRLAVAGYPPVTTLLDTGGKGTEALSSAVPGLTGGELRSTGHGVGGTESFGRDVPGQALEIDGGQLAVERLILRDQMGAGYQILVGMDTLRGSVLAVSHDQQRPVHWLFPAD